MTLNLKHICMKPIGKKLILLVLAISLGGYKIKAQDGETLFKQKCAACHRADTKRMVGPGLGGIKDRRSEQWLISWIKDSQALIKSGDADAKAIYEEYNQVMMTPFSDLSDGDIKAMLDYLQGGSSGGSATAETAPAEPEKPIEYTADDIALGRALFSGSARFVNGGPSCITCHNVTNDEIIPGGLLAKDLTKVYERMGHAGITGIVSAPPFPAMTNSYGENPLTEDEMHQLAAFFKQANDVAEQQTANAGYGMMIKGGVGGLIVILILISILWSQRKKQMVKEEIFKRQLKGNDSKVY